MTLCFEGKFPLSDMHNFKSEGVSIPSNLEEVTKQMKSHIKFNIENGLYSNALFFADKLFYLIVNNSMTSISDNLFELAQCFYLNKEYYRCVNFIQKYNMTYFNIKFLNLIGQSLLASEDYDGVINYLDKKDLEFIENSQNFSPHFRFYQSIRNLLLGKAYEMLENKPLAIQRYIESLRYNSANIEAFDILINHQLLNFNQRKKLLEELQFTKLDSWLNDYYVSKISEHVYMTEFSDVVTDDTNNKVNIIEILFNNMNQDIMKIEVEKFFNSRDYQSSFLIEIRIVDEDLYKLDAIPMYCACMIDLNKVGDLYYLAHKLVNHCNDKYVTWFAVGSYYYCIKKYEMARKYFHKSIQINKHFPEGWIALGNSYASQDESDQALGAYRTCLRLFPGCHQANLYIGMEYLRTNNYKIALICFNDAINTFKEDPIIYNEVGVVFYKQRKFNESENYFLKGIQYCKDEYSSLVYQNLIINLAHTYRKQKKYDEAIEFYNKVLKIDSKNFSVISSIAYSYHLKGDFKTALDLYHKANLLKCDDQFVMEMINRCLQNLIDNSSQII